MSYVLTHKNTFLEVCSKDIVVINWAKWAKWHAEVVCMKYDDVGVCVGEVNLAKTRETGKVTMMY